MEGQGKFTREWNYVLLDFAQNHSLIIQDAIQKSGAKPNLVAKIWPPSLVTICAWLPKLVAKVSSQFHHLVNAGLAFGSHAEGYH